MYRKLDRYQPPYSTLAFKFYVFPRVSSTPLYTFYCSYSYTTFEYTHFHFICLSCLHSQFHKLKFMLECAIDRSNKTYMYIMYIIYASYFNTYMNVIILRFLIFIKRHGSPQIYVYIYKYIHIEIFVR